MKFSRLMILHDVADENRIVLFIQVRGGKTDDVRVETPTTSNFCHLLGAQAEEAPAKEAKSC